MIEFVDFEDGAVLDLVAHFLGIATHDNINAPPSALSPDAIISEAEDPDHGFSVRYQSVAGGPHVAGKGYPADVDG